MKTIFHYRAWKLDADGNVITGIEEELTMGRYRRAAAISKAWGRAAGILMEEEDSGTIQMEYVRCGEMRPAGDVQMKHIPTEGKCSLCSYLEEELANPFVEETQK